MSNILETVVQGSKAKNEYKDCAVRAVSIACNYTYDDTHYAFQCCGRRHRRGTRWEIIEKVVELLRFRMVDVTDHFSSRTVRTLEREMRGRRGSYLVRVYKHVLPVVNGKVYDWTKGRLHRVNRVFKLVEVTETFHFPCLQSGEWVGWCITSLPVLLFKGG